MPHYLREIQHAKFVVFYLFICLYQANDFRFVLNYREDAFNNHGPVFLRSYMHPHESRDMGDIKIWQAAHATSAAPVYFSPIELGDYKLVDGALAANNPLGW